MVSVRSGEVTSEVGDHAFGLMDYLIPAVTEHLIPGISQVKIARPVGCDRGGSPMSLAAIQLDRHVQLRPKRINGEIADLGIEER